MKFPAKLPKMKKLSEGFSQFLDNLTTKQLMAVMALIAVLIGAIIYNYLVSATQVQKQIVAGSLVPVVVAKQDIQPHTLLTESMLKVVEVPSELAPEGAITNLEAAAGKVTEVAIMAGDVVTSHKLTGDTRLAGFTGSIPPDCRAISVGITDVTGIAGFAKPGDHVDIVLVSNKKEKNKVMGEIILQDVLLLAINKNNAPQPAAQQQQPAPAADGSVVGKPAAVGSAPDASAAKENMATATLALRPEEALQLAVAQSEGTIYLILRPVRPVEKYVADTSYFDFQADQATQQGNQTQQGMPYQSSAQPPAPGGAAPSAPPAAAPSSPGGGSTGIVIYRGTQSSMDGVK